MGYIVYCISKIVDDARISDNVLRTFLCISNFLKADGYAYCSNEWLCNKRDLDIRNVRRHLEALEKAAYIWREIWSDGMKRKRRIWLPEKYLMHLEIGDKEDPEFKKFLQEGEYVRSEEGAQRPLDEGDNAPMEEGDNAPSYIRKNVKEELESSSAAPIVHNSKPPDPPGSADTFAAASFSDKYPKIFYKLSQEDQDRAVKCYAKKMKGLDIHNSLALMTDLIKEEWYKEPQNQEFELPPQDPESIVNKRENLEYAKHVIERLECVQELELGLTRDFLRFTHTDGGSDLINLAESSYEFRTRIAQILRRFKLSPELYLAEDREVKKEDIIPN